VSKGEAIRQIKILEEGGVYHLRPTLKKREGGKFCLCYGLIGSLQAPSTSPRGTLSPTFFKKRTGAREKGEKHVDGGEGGRRWEGKEKIAGSMRIAKKKAPGGDLRDQGGRIGFA